MMRLRQKTQAAGITLVELLVVLAVLSLLAAVAIPAIASLGNFMRTDLQSTSQEVHSLLRAARIYATTHRVDTAVVYSLDGFDASAVGIRDNVRGETVRAITSAAMLYRRGDTWGPIPGDDGEFRGFRGTTVIPLLDLRSSDLAPLYTDTSRDVFNPDSAESAPLLQQYGMQTVLLQVDSRPLPVPFPAHTFNSRGMLASATSGAERFVFWLTPSPDSPRNERLIEPERNTMRLPDDTGTPNLLHIPIELYRSTGKVKIINE
jgi:type II secretory pathway pseudopilin PulG